MYKSDLGKRMKEYYEFIPKTKLMRRTPVAIRLDGKAFHTFTKGFMKPFDSVMIRTMYETTLELCKNIQGCVFGYTQSDEITLILQDYKELNTAAWFDYEVQKLCSVSASMATCHFNRIFAENSSMLNVSLLDHANCVGEPVSWEKLYNVHQNAVKKGAVFDSRCFNIPKEEVANLILWRQLDATINSIQSLGQAIFSHKELHNKSQKDILSMLIDKKGIYWENLPVHQKRGIACIKDEDGKWRADLNMPKVNLDRNYVERYIYFEGEN